MAGEQTLRGTVWVEPPLLLSEPSSGSIFFSNIGRRWRHTDARLRKWSRASVRRRVEGGLDVAVEGVVAVVLHLVTVRVDRLDDEVVLRECEVADVRGMLRAGALDLQYRAFHLGELIAVDIGD